MATFELDLIELRQSVSDNYADMLGIPFDEVPELFGDIVAMVHPDDQRCSSTPTPSTGRRTGSTWSSA